MYWKIAKEYFRYWTKSLTAADVGALMIVVPIAAAVVMGLVVLVMYETRATIAIVFITLWVGTAVYLLKKDEDGGLW